MEYLFVEKFSLALISEILNLTIFKRNYYF